MFVFFICSHAYLSSHADADMYQAIIGVLVFIIILLIVIIILQQTKGKLFSENLLQATDLIINLLNYDFYLISQVKQERKGTDFDQKNTVHFHHFQITFALIGFWRSLLVLCNFPLTLYWIL